MDIAENLGMVQNDDEKGRELNRKFYSHPNLPSSYIEEQFDSLVDSGATYGADTEYSDAWDDFFDIVERRPDTSEEISHKIRKMKKEYAQFGKEQRILERLSHDHHPMIRETVARNPNLGLKELDRVSNEDKDEDVRNAAFVTYLKLRDKTLEDKEETNRLLKLNNWK